MDPRSDRPDEVPGTPLGPPGRRARRRAAAAGGEAGTDGAQGPHGTRPLEQVPAQRDQPAARQPDPEDGRPTLPPRPHPNHGVPQSRHGGAGREGQGGYAGQAGPAGGGQAAGDGPGGYAGQAGPAGGRQAAGDGPGGYAGQGGGRADHGGQAAGAGPSGYAGQAGPAGGGQAAGAGAGGYAGQPGAGGYPGHGGQGAPAGRAEPAGQAAGHGPTGQAAADSPGDQRSSAEATAETQAQAGVLPPPPVGKLAVAAAAARSAGSAAASFGRGSARFSARVSRGVVRRIRRATHAQGAGETGLGRMIELHAFSNGGDAAMAVGLAGTLFFTVPSAEARGNVALYLLLTMAPFAVLAPLIGPFLDRFRRGRRWAIGSTLAVRGFFCWVVADALASQAWYLYPLVLGCLVASKAYNVTRASAVPRLLPQTVPLVTANSRISLAGTIGAVLFAAIAGALSFIGPEWALRWAFVVFIIGTILAIRLPARVDSSEGEETVGMAEVAGNRHKIPAVVVLALRANAAFRALAGFLLMFMAFLLRQHPLQGVPAVAQVGIVAGAAGIGAFAGTSLGALTRDRLKRPEIVVIVLLGIVAATATVSAFLYGLIAIAVFALVTGVCQQLGKLSLDALIQREVPEEVRTSVFGRSETVLQLAWVLGGGLGIVLPLIPQLGLGICAVGLAAAFVIVLRTRTLSAPAPTEPMPTTRAGE